MATKKAPAATRRRAAAAAPGKSVAPAAPASAAAAPVITHHGMVNFSAGQYAHASGTDNWTVGPIAWPSGPPGPPAVGQVLITFKQPINGPYTVMVCACRTLDAPMLSANYGEQGPAGFVVILFNTVGDQSYTSVRNGDFSFIIIQ
jgi:hypothetical protein